MPNAAMTLMDHTPDLTNINRARRAAGMQLLPRDVELNLSVKLFEQKAAADRKKQHDVRTAKLTAS